MITKTLIVQTLPEPGQLKPKTYYAVQKGEKFTLHLTDDNGIVKEMQILSPEDLAKITGIETKVNNLTPRVEALETKRDKYVTGVTAEKQGNNVVFTYSFSEGEPVTVTVEDKDTLPTVFDDSELKNRLNALETFKGTTEAKDAEQDGKIQALETAKASTEALNGAKQELENKIGEKLAKSDFDTAKSALEGRIQALENASNENIGTWA